VLTPPPGLVLVLAELERVCRLAARVEWVVLALVVGALVVVAALTAGVLDLCEAEPPHPPRSATRPPSSTAVR
jgi:hypothetical protein